MSSSRTLLLILTYCIPLVTNAVKHSPVQQPPTSKICAVRTSFQPSVRPTTSLFASRARQLLSISTESSNQTPALRDEDTPMSLEQAQQYFLQRISSFLTSYLKDNPQKDSELIREILLAQWQYKVALYQITGGTEVTHTQNTIKETLFQFLKLHQVLTATQEVKKLIDLTQEEFADYKEELRTSLAQYQALAEE